MLEERRHNNVATKKFFNENNKLIPGILDGRVGMDNISVYIISLIHRQVLIKLL